MKNNKIIEVEGLTFDDLLLLPSYSEIKREEINLSVRLSQNIKLEIPLLSSPMDTVTTSEMAISMGKLGGLGVIHRNMTIEKQEAEVAKTKENVPLVAAAVGVGKDMEERMAALTKAGLDLVVVDSAHGYSKTVIEATRFISSHYPSIYLVSGNVATPEGAKALIDAGSQAIRVGMGPGSICTTRIVTGIGVPQVTAIMDTAEIAKERGVLVIADGGIRFSGDIVKALAVGASLVMLGSLIASAKESPGKVVEQNGKKFKSYRGMGSVEAMREGSAIRYGQEYRIGQENKLTEEGVSGLVPYKGDLEAIITKLVGGVRSGMYYSGAKNINELHARAKLIKVSKASLIESHPHNIKINI